MEYKKFNNKIVARIDKGEEILKQIKEIALKENIKLASVRALGATNDFTVGVFKTDEKKYYSNEFKGNFEIVSLTGTINTMNGEFYTHIHMSAGNDKGEVFGGHLNKAIVSATCEMVIDIIDGTVDRYFDEEHYGLVIVDVTENGSLSELNLSRFKDGTYLDLVSNSNVVISNHKIVSAIMDDSCIMVLSSDSFDESNINNDKVNILIDNNDKYLTPSSTINISVSNASESYFQINSGQKIQFSNQIKIDLKDYSFSDNQDITLKVYASNETDDSEISKSYKFFNATSNNIYLLDLENQYDLSNSNSALWVWNEGENGAWLTDFDKQDYYLNFNINYDFFIYVRFYSNNIDWTNCEYQTIDLNTSKIIYELNEVIK